MPNIKLTGSIKQYEVSREWLQDPQFPETRSFRAPYIHRFFMNNNTCPDFLSNGVVKVAENRAGHCIPR